MESSGVLARIKSLYRSSQWHDLEFHVKDENTGETMVLRAHRLILATSSPVFEALCFGPLAEKGTIIITDIDPKAFEAMLQFLYTDSIQFDNSKSMDLASNVLYAARKYVLPSLAAQAENYLINNLTDRNCIDIYNLADILGCNIITEHAFNHICRRLKFVINYVDKDNIKPELILKLVTSEFLNCEEMVLVKLALLWAKCACEDMGLEETITNLRNLLLQYNIFQYIRWETINFQDLCNIYPDLLSKEELSRLGNTTNLRRDPCPVTYAYIHRYIIDNRNTIDPETVREGITICTRMTVNKPVTLQGLFIAAKSVPSLLLNQPSPPRYKERMELTIVKKKYVALTQNISQEVDFGRSFYVRLNENLPVSDDIKYDVMIRLFSPITKYPSCNLSNETKNPSGLVVSCCDLADFNDSGIFTPIQGLALVSGFEFLC